MKCNITFVVFTFNEERRIEYVLRCFKDYGNIVIIDNCSTDKTLEIARKYGAEVYQHNTSYGFAEHEKMVEFVFERVLTDWVYWGYADELCPKTLLEKFVEISDQNKYEIVFERRRNFHYGLENLGLEHAYQMRLFKKKAVDFKDNVIHNFGKVICPQDKILRLPPTDEYSIYHFSNYTISKFENSHNKYSDIEARHNVQYGKKYSLIKMILDPIRVFIIYFFLNGGWKSGNHGLIMTMQYCFFRFNLAAKTWEIENNISLETIEQKYDALKEKMIT